MKNKHDGWSARRRYKREADRVARRLGYANQRSMRHAQNVEDLRRILGDLMLHRGAPAPENADRSLFDTRAVAEAIGSTAKVIRHLVFVQQLAAEPALSEKARKLFFRPSAIAEFLWSRRIPPGAEALRSTVVANPRGVGGIGYTKREAARQLEISARVVERHLRSGLLKTTKVSNKRMILITGESISALAARLVDQEDRAHGLALKTLDRARKKLL
jgi:hypothetical protein